MTERWEVWIQRWLENSIGEQTLLSRLTSGTSKLFGTYDSKEEAERVARQNYVYGDRSGAWTNVKRQDRTSEKSSEKETRDEDD